MQAVLKWPHELTREMRKLCRWIAFYVNRRARLAKAPDPSILLLRRRSIDLHLEGICNLTVMACGRHYTISISNADIHASIAYLGMTPARSRDRHLLFNWDPRQAQVDVGDAPNRRRHSLTVRCARGIAYLLQCALACSIVLYRMIFPIHYIATV